VWDIEELKVPKNADTMFPGELALFEPEPHHNHFNTITTIYSAEATIVVKKGLKGKQKQRYFHFRQSDKKCVGVREDGKKCMGSIDEHVTDLLSNKFRCLGADSFFKLRYIKKPVRRREWKWVDYQPKLLTCWDNNLWKLFEGATVLSAEEIEQQHEFDTILSYNGPSQKNFGQPKTVTLDSFPESLEVNQRWKNGTVHRVYQKKNNNRYY
jgi:hypothetical protein